MVSLTTTLGETQFIKCMAKHTTHLCLSASYNTTVMCMVMLCCSTYNMNSHIYNSVTHTTFAKLWNKLFTVPPLLVSSTAATNIIMGHTEDGYRACMSLWDPSQQMYVYTAYVMCNLQCCMPPGCTLHGLSPHMNWHMLCEMHTGNGARSPPRKYRSVYAASPVDSMQ